MNRVAAVSGTKSYFEWEIVGEHWSLGRTASNCKVVNGQNLFVLGSCPSLLEFVKSRKAINLRMLLCWIAPSAVKGAYFNGVLSKCYEYERMECLIQAPPPHVA